MEKGTLHKDVDSLFGLLKNTLSTWKKNKDKIFEKYNSVLISKRVKPEKYKERNKAVHKWFLILRSENVPISWPIGGSNIEEFQASEDGWKNEKRSKVYISLYF